MYHADAIPPAFFLVLSQRLGKESVCLRGGHVRAPLTSVTTGSALDPWPQPLCQEICSCDTRRCFPRVL